MSLCIARSEIANRCIVRDCKTARRSMGSFFCSFHGDLADKYALNAVYNGTRCIVHTCPCDRNVKNVYGCCSPEALGRCWTESSARTGCYTRQHCYSEQSHSPKREGLMSASYSSVSLSQNKQQQQVQQSQQQHSPSPPPPPGSARSSIAKQQQQQQQQHQNHQQQEGTKSESEQQARSPSSSSSSPSPSSCCNACKMKDMQIAHLKSQIALLTQQQQQLHEQLQLATSSSS